jgi:branched-chain amino acid transport system ATP-binding protein
MSETLLEIRQLRAGYGEAEVLHGIELSVSKGEFVCIIGANTAGKSTILRAISRLVPKSSGIMRLNAVDLMRSRRMKSPHLASPMSPKGARSSPR